MADLSNLTGHTYALKKITQAGNIFSNDNITCLLKPVSRDFNGKSKKPVYYLSSIENGKATYLSGLFKTNDNQTFSADYKDTLNIKHLVKIKFSDGGKLMTVEGV